MKSLILLFISIVFFWSCKTTEYITRTEKQIDTIQIEKTIVDTLYQEKEIIKTKEIKSNIFLPCPDDNQKTISGKTGSGDSSAQWSYDSIKGGYNIELYCAEQISIRDSINRQLKVENNMLKTSQIENATEIYTVTEKSNFWQSVLKHIWKISFFIVLIFWLFGITPKYIFKTIY